MGKFCVKIDTTGTVSVLECPEPSLEFLYKEIGCELVEYVNVGHPDEKIIMLVDESGWLKDDPIPNLKASLLYSDTTDSIAGNAVLLRRNRCDWEAFSYPEAVLLKIAVEALFVSVGQVPELGAFADVLPLTRAGYADVDAECAAPVPGVFAAGDCRGKTVRQLTTAVGDGAVAALNACRYLEST